MASTKFNAQKYKTPVGYVPTSVSSKLSNYNSGYTGNSGAVYSKGQNLRSEGYPNTYSTGRTTYSPSGTAEERFMNAHLKSSGGSTPSASSSASRSYSSSSSADYDPYDDSDNGVSDSYSALLAAYSQRQNDYEEYLRQMREAAQNAYDRSMGALNSAYDSQMSSLSGNLNETKNQLLNQYNLSKNSINKDAENSLRQAYINNMLNRKNLAQQMSAQGLTGGATETTMANMLNNYGNARNAINTTANSNLANLEGNYSGNLSQAMQAYNSAVANANLQKAQQQMSLENALSNNQISALSDYQSLLQRDNQNYLDLLKTAIANGMNFSYNPTAANNEVKAVALQQAANPTLQNNYAALQALLNNAQTPGVNSPGMTVANPSTASDLMSWINYIQGSK